MLRLFENTWTTADFLCIGPTGVGESKCSFHVDCKRKDVYYLSILPNIP